VLIKENGAEIEIGSTELAGVSAHGVGHDVSHVARC
jgi:hypothetical protein